MRSGSVPRLIGFTLTAILLATRCPAQDRAGLPAEHPGHSTEAPPGETQQAVPAQAGLTLADLEAMALGYNPTIGQAREHVEMARGRKIQAGLFPNPVLGYSGEEIGSEGRAGQQGVFIEQTIPTAGKLRLSRDTFSQEEHQERWGLYAQQLRVQNTIHILFYQTLAAEELVKTRDRLSTIADSGVQVTEQLFNVGQADRPDVLAAKNEARKARVELNQAENRHRRLWTDLVAVAGQPNLGAMSLQGDLIQKDAPLLDREAAWAKILAQSPELQLARFGISRAQSALQRARVEPIPNVFVRGGTAYDYADGNQIAAAEIGLNIPLFDRNQGNIRTEEAALRHACGEVQRLELSLRSRFAAAFERYSTARTTVDEYGAEILPQSYEAFALYADAFRKHNAAYPQVLIAQRSYFEASVDYLDALSELRTAEVELNGLLLSDGLMQPEPHGVTSPEPPGLPVRSLR